MIRQVSISHEIAAGVKSEFCVAEAKDRACDGLAKLSYRQQTGIFGFVTS
jgi:hypothetical protein